MSDRVVVTMDHGVADVRLNRADKMNALDPAMFDALVETTDSLAQIAGDLKAVSQSAENAAFWGEMGAFRMAELMEAAKHNWLFRRYFEERGSVEAAPFEVREEAIKQSFNQITQRERELLLWEQRLQALETDLAARKDSTIQQ